VKREDCLDGCVRFTNEKEKIYCNQVCGLAPASEQQGECKEESGLKRDYCFKDEAIKTKSFLACKKISDVNIRKTCENRVTEDLMDAQKAELE